MAYSCKFVEKSAMKTRIEIIQEILDKIYDSSDIFDNDDVPYIPYRYDTTTDKLMSQYASVIISHKSEDIDVVIMEGYISR